VDSSNLSAIATLEELISEITKAQVDKSLFKWEVEEFNQLFDRLESLASADESLLVVATLGRIEAALKKPLFDLDRVTKIVPDNPDLQVLSDGDDRHYATTLIVRLDQEWIVPWCLYNAWSEPKSEKARKEHLVLLLSKMATIKEYFEQLGKAGNSYVKKEELDEDKVATRQSRVIKVIRSVIQGWNEPAELEFGETYDAFIGAPYAHFAPSKCKADARKPAVNPAIGLLNDLIGKRFTLAIESLSYKPLARLQKWCEYETWRKICKEDPEIDKLRSTISDALLVLARQNVTDSDLMRSLRLSCFDEHQFSEICRVKADAGHLNADIESWLRSGGKLVEERDTLKTEKAISERELADEVANLMTQICDAEQSIAAADAAKNDLELFDPDLVPVVENISNHHRLLSETVKAIAERQGLKLVGEIGEKIDIDRTLFEVASEGDRGERRGTVVRPAVVTSDPGRTRVVRKGVVRV
jgi:hypothetical protein